MMDKVITNASQRVTNKYSKNHTGVDLKASQHEIENYIFAHSSGVIVAIKDGYDRMIGARGMASYGNYIDIEHKNGYKTRYAHLKKNSICVKVGQQVNNSTKIAEMGNTGNTIGITGKHLHFEVVKNGVRINPEKFLKQEFGAFITYQSHDKYYGWNPNVNLGTYEYAGNFGYNIDAIYLDQYQMRVHDMVTNTWLPWVKNRNDYAGNLGNAIDGVQILEVSYRVHLKNGDWLAWVYKCDDTNEGYAGLYGYPIDAIQIKNKSEVNE